MIDPITGAAIIGGGASLLGGLLGQSSGNKQARAAENAARMQAEAAQAAIAEQRRQYDQTRQDFAPYAGAGAEGLGQYLTGLKSGAYSPGQFGFEEKPFQFDTGTDPGAQNRMDRAMKAIQASASARGGVLGTGALRNMMQESQRLAADEYGAAYNRNQSENQINYGRATDAYNRDYGAKQDLANRFQGLGQMGMQAAGQQGQFGAQAANQIGSLGMAGASAMGQGMADAAQARAMGQGAMFQGASDAIGQGLGAMLYQRPKSVGGVR